MLAQIWYVVHISWTLTFIRKCLRLHQSWSVGCVFLLLRSTLHKTAFIWLFFCLVQLLFFLALLLLDVLRYWVVSYNPWLRLFPLIKFISIIWSFYFLVMLDEVSRSRFSAIFIFLFHIRNCLHIWGVWLANTSCHWVTMFTFFLRIEFNWVLSMFGFSNYQFVCLNCLEIWRRLC